MQHVREPPKYAPNNTVGFYCRNNIYYVLVDVLYASFAGTWMIRCVYGRFHGEMGLACTAG